MRTEPTPQTTESRNRNNYNVIPNMKISFEFRIEKKKAKEHTDVFCNVRFLG